MLHKENTSYSDVIKMFKHAPIHEPEDDSGNEDDFDLSDFIRLFTAEMVRFDRLTELSNFEKAKKEIFYMLVPSDNPSIDQNVHRDFHDMRIIYAFFLDDDKKDIYVVNNAMLEKWNVTEEELFAFAKVNTPKLLPAIIMENLDMSFINEIGDIKSHGVISNPIKRFGSTSILYNDFLRELTKTYGENIYLIPCFMDYVLMLSSSNEINDWSYAYERLNRIESISEFETLLSKKVFKYDKETDQLIVMKNSRKD